MIRPKFNLKFAFLILTVAALVAFWFRPRVVIVDFELSRFADEVHSYRDASNVIHNDPYVAAYVRVSNRSPNTIWYRGTHERPLYSISQQIGEKWDWSGHWWDNDWHKFPRGGSFEFMVELRDDAEIFKVDVLFYTRCDDKYSSVGRSKEFVIDRSD